MPIELTGKKLQSLDWKFGVTVGTDEIDQLGTTHLQMRMGIRQTNGSIEYHCVEYTLTQFYEFLSELEKASTEIECM